MNTTVNIGGTFFLALVWLALVWTWKHQQFRGIAYLMSLLPLTYFLPYLVSLRYTSLKGRSPRAQAIFIAGLSTALATFLLVVGWITTKV